MRSFIILALVLSVSLFASVGEIVAVSGNVSVVRAQSQTAAQNGFKLEQKDEIKSGEDGKAQVLFSDGTIITVGKNSTLKVEEFVFDEKGGDAKAKIGMGNGVFKAITGQIGKINPDNMKLTTKTATIGIRGTQILALLDDAQEKIACTQGAIYVDVNGYKVDVLAGQITTILAGAIPASPTEIKPEDMQQFRGGLGIGKELAAKIGSVKIDKNFNVDQAKLKEVFDDISKIKEDDTRIAALDLLEDTLINQVETLYEEGYYKIAAPKANQVQYAQNDGYTSLGWGYYTHKPIESKGGSFMVDNTPYTSYTDAIKAAVIKEAWRSGAQNYTPSSTISKTMGGDGVSEVAPNSWDGRANDRIVASYSGKTLGFESHKGESVPFELTTGNNSKIVVDFGNRVIYGKIDFDVKRSDGKVESWRLGFIDGGKVALAPTSFFTDKLYADKESESLIYGYTMQGRFFGKDANQLSFYFEGLSNDIDPIDCASNCPNDKNILGVLIANKESAVTLSKQEEGKDDYFSWGYWASGSFDKSIQSSIEKANVSGAYIKPSGTLTETPANKIDEMKLSNVKASYNADIIGTVASPNTNLPTELIQKGSARFDFDFGKGSVTGEMGLSSANTAWHIQLQNGTVDGNGFKIDKIANFSDAVQKVVGYEIGGNFFGNEAQKIGGGFNLISNDNKIATGAFHGGK